MSKLILFPNSKSRDYYLYSRYNYYSLDITNYKTLFEFYRTTIDKFFKNFSIKNNVSRLEESTAIINIYEALIEFTNKNKDSIISKQNKNYELAANIYNFIEEITFAKIIIGKDNEDLDLNNNLEDIKKIVSIYKSNNKAKNLFDDNDIFELFINSINKKEIDDFKEYEEIEIYNFESVPLRYSIFLEAINKNYNINIKAFMPYNIDKIFSNYKEFYQGINNFEYSNISDFSKALINKNNKEDLNKYKEQIKLIAGFGINQEIDTVIDEVIKLKNYNIPLSDIALIFSDTQKYREAVARRLKECNIKFNQRRGNFIWRMPLIPVLTSIFFIIERGKEIDIDALIKLLSSPYLTNIDGINPYNIRELLYSKDFRIFKKMPLSDFLYNIENNKEHKEISNSIIKLIELLKKLMSSDTYSKIGSAYIEILKFLKIDLIFEENIEEEKYYNSVYIKKDEIFYRDNDSLASFVEIVLKLTANDNSKNKISPMDFHEALNILIKDEYLRGDNNKEISLTISNLYDARGLKAKYLFILGANNDFINRKPDTFFISNKVRESINNKYKKYVLSSQNLLSDISYALFLNIISSCYDNGIVYFSFRLKDKDGNLEIPFFYIEDLFLELGNEDFKFDTLKENGLIFRENYIPKGNNIHSKKENIMSLFFYKENYEYPKDISFDKNIKNIVNLVYNKNEESVYTNPQNFISILKEDLSNTISVSKIKEIMECPIKYIYNRLFERDSIDSLIMGINRMDKGTIYHKIFENFYNKIKEKFNNNCKLKEDKFNSYKNIASEIIEEYFNKKEIKIYNEADKEVMIEEINNVMNSFIKYEIYLSKNSDYIPNNFEEKINEFKVYSYNNHNINISGRIDRIDFSYSKDNKINGIRIVDYKANVYPKELKKYLSKLTTEEIINAYLQPILYLKYAIDEYIIKPNKSDNFNIDELVEKCEVVFAIYKEADIVNKEDYIIFDNKDILLTICGYKDGDFNLNDYFDRIFKNIFEDKLIAVSGKEQCENCINYQNCEYSYKEE
ncbi:PD-(D/E)XK nuclease family protein [Brachyspira aalborgi]|uniref:PD-(D/E)XK nuclease family protein n=1 Tax=Brachyspira aalborgi TaxID=29522 RepID=UPI0011C9FEA2|nr:PD-(D/E)XK nuclease family protein [Brachyspira aalborgi]TXJ51522.1 PD-(D/E)XK nuclease family protein [Brachyspira aalborgi]